MFVGGSRREGVKVDLVYLDLFAGAGSYEGDADLPRGPAPVYGSPIIAARELTTVAAAFRHQGLDVRVTVIAIDKEHFGELAETARNSGVTIPVIETNRVSGAVHGSFVVMPGDCRGHLPEILKWLRHDEFVFALVDPYGETMRLHEDLEPLLRRQKTDSIVLFPVMEVDKHGGSVLKPPADRTAVEVTNLDRTTAHFGSDRWMKIASTIHSTQLPEREVQYADLYAESLSGLDGDLAVKKIGLQLSKVDRLAYHLFLTTRDADGALRMNDILRKAGIREHWTLWCDREQRLRDREPGQGLLFEVEYVPPPQPDQISAEEVAAVITEALGSARAIEIKELMKRLANDLYTGPDVQKGLRFLKKKGKIDFEDFKPRSLITVIRSD